MSDEIAKTRRRFGPGGKRSTGREVGLNERVADQLEARERWDRELWDETMREILPALRADEQLVLLLHDLDQMRFREIAKILHRSEDAVRKLRKRALWHGREMAASMN